MPFLLFILAFQVGGLFFIFYILLVLLIITIITFGFIQAII